MAIFAGNDEAFRRLGAYAGIGWDLDGTLIDHPASVFLHAFIKATPTIRHVIVTFRSHGMEDNVFDDLRQYPEAPLPSEFHDVINIGDDDFAAFSKRDTDRRYRGLILPDSPEEIFYKEWKGGICAQEGLTALVDDMHDLVELGCRKYGVRLFHPREFS